MAGGPNQPQQQSRQTDSPVPEEWFVVIGEGDSALRIAAGLTVGETDSGTLALNDPEPANQWIEFVLNDSGEPWVAIVTREKSLVVDGATHVRHRLNVGATVQLPNNLLYISQDIRQPRPSGVVLEVVPRQVPNRPQDLVAPGWEEALTAAREPAPDAQADQIRESSPAAAPQSSPAAAQRTPPAAPPYAATAAERHSMQPDPDITVREPGPNAPRYRRNRRARQNSLAITALALVAVTLAGFVVVLLLDRGDTADSEPALEFLDRRAAGEEVDPRAVGTPGTDSNVRDLGSTDPDPGPQGGAPVAAGREDAAEGPGAADSEGVAGTQTVPGEQGAAAERSAAGEPARAETPGEAIAPGSGPALDDRVALLEPVTAEPVETEQQPELADPDTPSTSPSTAATASQGTADRAAPQAAKPDWRLVRARELLDAGYITYPPQDNAVAYLERLLAVDPGNPQALALLELCTTELIDAAIRAHDQGLEYEARNTLEEVFAFNRDHQRANQLWREWVNAGR